MPRSILASQIRGLRFSAARKREGFSDRTWPAPSRFLAGISTGFLVCSCPPTKHSPSTLNRIFTPPRIPSNTSAFKALLRGICSYDQNWWPGFRGGSHLFYQNQPEDVPFLITSPDHFDSKSIVPCCLEDIYATSLHRRPRLRSVSTWA